ncbi:C39 family peptidase (plasmid) [Nicoliella spurrieriana]|uniref:C39 family peptidase n=1 Tax=Nicoliella spurrieriana TaxID=2925830 RepID=A0A976X515_9LACO|nr:C39 family peptidase [Nicoliella spurrieriana]UQS86072.1 C39 family peptidase [Nicoliella spurrieriana]
MKKFKKIIIGSLLVSEVIGLTLFVNRLKTNADDTNAGSSVASSMSASSVTSSTLSSSSSSLASSASGTSTPTDSSSSTDSSNSGSTASSSSTNSKQNVTYTIKNANNYVMRVINTSSARIWDSPYTPSSKVKNNTTNLNGKLIKITQTARGTDGSLYYHITYQGTDLGWIHRSYLSYTDDYEMPYVYTSQLYPIYAPSGCEAAAMKMALSTKGQALNIPLDKFINLIPKSSDPNKGYKNDPFTKGAGATIYPNAMASFIKRYASGSKDITNTSLSNIIYNIKRGNPVVFEGSWRMVVNSKSDHVLVILGYKPGKFLIADPYMRKNSPNKVFWTSTSDFLKIWHNEKRGSRALLVK